VSMSETNDRERPLTAALRAVAEDDARLDASSSVERLLREEVRLIAARRRRAWTIAVIAAVLVAAAAVPLWRTVRSRNDAARIAAAALSTPPPEIASEFLPLAYSGVPVTDGRIVRLAVPRAALASFGLAPLDSSEVGTVMADVIVGEDGLARAVRFVRPSRRAVAREQNP
jgi:hypothetical protein